VYENSELDQRNFTAIKATIDKNREIGLSESDVAELKQLNDLVLKKEYQTTDFSNSSLDLVYSLLKPDRWPDGSLFQGIVNNFFSFNFS
jgi:hypothetical protein